MWCKFNNRIVTYGNVQPEGGEVMSITFRLNAFQLEKLLVPRRLQHYERGNNTEDSSRIRVNR